jgi:hypothetical protein
MRGLKPVTPDLVLSQYVANFRANEQKWGRPEDAATVSDAFTSHREVGSGPAIPLDVDLREDI